MKKNLTILTVILSLSMPYAQVDTLSKIMVNTMNDTSFLIVFNIGAEYGRYWERYISHNPLEIDSLKKGILSDYQKDKFLKKKNEIILESKMMKQKRDSIITAITNTSFPDFDAPDTEGVTHRPKAYEGRVLILHFWNFWDYSFDNEIPVLNELVGKYHGQGLEILSFTDLILGDSEKEYLKKNPIKFPLIENSRVFMRQFLKLNYYTIPYLIIADRKGNMRYFYIDGELNNNKSRMEYKPNGDVIEHISRDKNNKFGIEEKILSLLKEI